MKTRARRPVGSTWGSVRRWEAETRDRLRRHHMLWLHGWSIGLLVVAVMWGVAHLQMVTGSASLAVRYLVTLGTGYLVFLLVLRWWAGMLVGEEGSGPGGGSSGDGCPAGEAAVEAGDAASPFQPGGGGDFGGGGAEGGFEVVGEGGSALGEVASGALDVAGGADEGAVVVIPVLLVFAAGVAVLLGAGWLLLVFFGWEVLLAVAVEVAFGYVSGRTAVRMAREGWLGAAVRLTWKPLLGALACAVLLGAAIDRFVPDARSLPHALQLLRQK